MTQSFLKRVDSVRIKHMVLILSAMFLTLVIADAKNVTLSLTTHTHDLILFSLLVLSLLALHFHYITVRSILHPASRLLPSKLEYLACVHDILYHEQFYRLNEFYHHSGPIYEHSRRVSYWSYVVTKLLSMDYTAAARGGLLHDFFLYDYRERKRIDAKKSLHGKEHPQIALENSRLHFEVDPRQEDIIIKHMFPKTRDLPRYVESVIVSLVDKCVATYEYSQHLYRRIKPSK